jgi:DNA repair photolyase
MDRKENLCASHEKQEVVRIVPGLTNEGKPFDWFVQTKVKSGVWRLECIRPQVLGTKRPLEVYRAERKGKLIKPWLKQEDDDTYCPAHWADIAIGRGPCGYRCRACFLILTHRGFCDPSRHVLYENLDDYEAAVRKWLKKPNRKNLGLGIDCSDSLLYEGVVGHASRLIPLFADQNTNPHGCKLILLTKSTNIHYLNGLPTTNVILSMSLNPERIADLWEGKWNDGLRITPTIEERLEASKLGEAMDFEVRWRVDPIMPVDGWEETYTKFFETATLKGHRPQRITLGTYREMARSLSTIAKKWGLPPVEWELPELLRDGSHYHLPPNKRVEIYHFIRDAIENAWHGTGHNPIIALCKESRTMRASMGLLHDRCNCE